ncbi:hypothetical protein [Cloacibacillus sp.]
MKRYFKLYIIALMFLAVFCPAADSAVITEIDSAEQLAAFRDSVNAGDDYDGLNVRLTADIDLRNAEWLPIGTASSPFRGKFNGAGHKISGLNVTSAQSAAVPIGMTEYSGTALFLILSGRHAQIANLTVEGTAENTRQRGNLLSGGIVAYAGPDTVLFNCKNYVSVSVSGKGGTGHYGEEDYSIAGGVAAHLEGYIVNCVNYGAVNSASTSAYSIAAGLAGRTKGYILSSRNEGAVSVADIGLFQNIAGGVAGAGEGGVIFGVENEGGIYSSNVGGGIIGFAYGTSVQNALNSGKIGGTGQSGGLIISGGIIGKAYNGASAVNCANVGAVGGMGTPNYSYAGGLAGWSNAGPNSVENIFYNCSNSGVISGEGTTSTLVGGLVGEMGKSQLADSANSGSVNTGKDFAGGLVGNKFSNADIYDSVYPSGYDAVAYGALSARDCAALSLEQLAGFVVTVVPSISPSSVTLTEGDSKTLSVELRTFPGTPVEKNVFYSIVSLGAEPADYISVTADGGIVTVRGVEKGASLLAVQTVCYRSALSGGVDRNSAKKALISALAVVKEANASPDIPTLWPDIPPLVSPDISPVPPSGHEMPSGSTSSSSGCDAGGWAVLSLVTLPLAVYLYRGRKED